MGDYGIHSSVFPSAHVSSAFSAAWALFAYLPERKRYGWAMLIYAISVAVATVYGRYHYAADAVWRELRDQPDSRSYALRFFLLGSLAFVVRGLLALP